MPKRDTQPQRTSDRPKATDKPASKPRRRPEDDLISERRGPVHWIVFNRPEVRNAATAWMEERIVEICAEVNEDPGAKALVFAGVKSDTPAFTSGADFSRLGAVTSMEEILELEGQGEAVSAAVEAVRVPTLAAIGGACIGGGVLIAASCDVRIASPSLRFGFPLARTAGSCLSMKNYARLVTLLGFPLTRELLLTARLLGADALAGANAVREVVADDDSLHGRAQEIAEDLASLAPLTIWATKEALRRLRDQSIPETADRDLLAACYLSHDFREGVSAFLEKRKPAWTGK